jgi:hypothetical protein
MLPTAGNRHLGKLTFQGLTHLILVSSGAAASRKDRQTLLTARRSKKEQPCRGRSVVFRVNDDAIRGNNTQQSRVMQSHCLKVE